MHRMLSFALFVAVATMAAAQDPFSKSVRPDDFNAAGLNKLSPAELARLDALIQDFKNGTSNAAALSEQLAAARREAAAAASAKAAAEKRATQAEAAAAKATASEAAAKKNEGASLLSRAKVLLTPGTEIEFATVESRIAGTFRGWTAHSVFTLENGQRWQVDGTEAYDTSPVASPAVKIVPGVFGVFWMNVEGVRVKAKVKPLGLPK
jgi:hypothetical protein